MLAFNDRAGRQIAIGDQDFSRRRTRLFIVGGVIAVVDEGFYQIRRQACDGDGGNDKYGPC